MTSPLPILVTFEDPVWATIQGEGVLAGTPSVFVRMYGCDFACTWCDTKGSWRPGSVGEHWDLDKILTKARETGLGHAVITGGNPFLQVDALADLVVGLQSPWWSEEDGSFRPGMHVTVETQGSIFDYGVASKVDLISLSPKLHDWREDTVRSFISEVVTRRRKQAQVKVVVDSRISTQEAIVHFEDLYRWAVKRHGYDDDTGGVVESLVHFILQPESSTGRDGIKAVWSELEAWFRDRPRGYLYPNIRIIPQLHKTALYVR